MQTPLIHITKRKAKLAIPITYILCVFCFFQLLPFSAEVQPYAFFLCLFFAIKHLHKITAGTATILFLVCIFSFLGLIRYANNAISLYALTASLSSLIMGPLIFYFFSKNGPPKPKTNLSLVIFLSIFALVQTFYPVILDATGATTAIQYLIPRFSSSILTDWDRGVTLLAPEPANVAPILLMLLSTFLIHLSRNTFSSKIILIYITCFSVLFLTNKTITLFIALLIFSALVILFFCKKSFFIAALSILITTLAATFFSLAEFDYSSSRIGTLFHVLLNLNSENLILLDDLSGSRLSVLLVALSGFNRLGDGFGSWEYAFIDLAQQMPFDVFSFGFFERIGGAQSVKPSSFLALSVIDMGFFGLIYTGLLFTLILKKINFTSPNSLPVSCIFLTSILMLMIGGSPLTLPAYWAIAGMTKFSLTSHPEVQGNRTVMS